MPAMTTPIRVLMASTSYPADAADWRGLFIRQITFALARRQDVALKVWCPPGEFPAGVEYVANASDRAWLDQLSRSGGIAHAMRSGRPTAILRPLQLLRRLNGLYRRETAADVIHANWLQVALPLPADRRPLLVTVLGTDFKLLRIPGMKFLLQRVFSARRTVICPNADWMVQELRRHFGEVAEVQCVPFGIQEDYFSLTRRTQSPHQWLCVSRVTPAKIGDLFRWGEACFSGSGRQLHLFGPMQTPVPLPDWVVYHGPVSQAELLDRWFPRASGLISLSNHSEGRPQVMIEAMAAGLPIIASDLAAHRELVEANGAGIICRSAAELEPALETLETSTGPEAGKRAREVAARLYGTWDDGAARFASIYRRLAAR